MSSEIQELYMSPEIFMKMFNLRLLSIYSSDITKKCKVYLPQGLDSLPEALRYLHWDEYPLKSLPSNFIPQNLVELSMPNSQVKQLWNVVQVSFNSIV